MEKLQFKTSINCGNCVKSITPFLDEVEQIKTWSVNTDDDNKILTVEVDGITAAQVVDVVEDAGFDIEAMA